MEVQGVGDWFGGTLFIFLLKIQLLCHICNLLFQ